MRGDFNGNSRAKTDELRKSGDQILGHLGNVGSKNFLVAGAMAFAPLAPAFAEPITNPPKDCIEYKEMNTSLPVRDPSQPKITISGHVVENKLTEDSTTEAGTYPAGFKFREIILDHPLCRAEYDGNGVFIGYQVTTGALQTLPPMRAKWIGHRVVITGAISEPEGEPTINIETIKDEVSSPQVRASEGNAQACAGYASFETVHTILHIENISHAEADELINKSSEASKAWDKNYRKCMDIGPEHLKIHHYCRAPDSWEPWTPYKCKEYRPWSK
jgi:hypothetical protein